MAMIFSNRKAIKKRVRQAENHMMFPLSEQILHDCNYFCRQDQDGLIASSLIASEPQNGILVWDTDYAKRMFYTGTPSTDVNPNASLRWCDKAQAAYGKDWKRIAQIKFSEGMGK